MKMECTTIARVLIFELDNRFPHNDLLNALEVVFLRYWMQKNCEEDFHLYLVIIKKDFVNVEVLM